VNEPVLIPPIPCRGAHDLGLTECRRSIRNARLKQVRPAGDSWAFPNSQSFLWPNQGARPSPDITAVDQPGIRFARKPISMRAHRRTGGGA